MQFYDFEPTRPILDRTYGQWMRMRSDRDVFATLFHQDRRRENAMGDKSHLGALWRVAENRWLEARRPFYNVWPSVLPMLLRLDLAKIECKWVKPIMPELLVRLPVKNNPLDLGPCRSVRNFLVCGVRAIRNMPPMVSYDYFMSQPSLTAMSIHDYNYDGLFFAIDMGERETDDAHDAATGAIDAPRRTLQLFWLEHDRTVEDQELRVDANGCAIPIPGVPIDTSLIRACVKLYCTLALMDHESELINAIVFNKDRRKYDETGNERYVEKARRRGLVGWEIGRHLEVIPHYRRPHYGIRHTGPGRKIPKIRPIRGSIVHREKVGDVPTGYQGKPEGEDND